MPLNINRPAAISMPEGFPASAWLPFLNEENGTGPYKHQKLILYRYIAMIGPIPFFVSSLNPFEFVTPGPGQLLEWTSGWSGGRRGGV